MSLMVCLEASIHGDMEPVQSMTKQMSRPPELADAGRGASGILRGLSQLAGGGICDDGGARGGGAGGGDTMRWKCGSSWGGTADGCAPPACPIRLGMW
mmetsp:Transcript_13422/g.38148  ORF Transcript_13422/g.38148 Transcript_13422/m.38148 type:complete len:98 (-) Transcript_13422:234-527(-)